MIKTAIKNRCEQIIENNDPYQGYEHRCKFKAVATATSKDLRNVLGEFMQKRLCSRHAKIYVQNSFWNYEVKYD
jgi:uncharacterized protein with ATP-grasp and redox domains